LVLLVLIRRRSENPGDSFVLVVVLVLESGRAE
jgi:hypothetical protein